MANFDGTAPPHDRGDLSSTTISTAVSDVSVRLEPCPTDLLHSATSTEELSLKGGYTAKYASPTAHSLHFQTSPLEHSLDLDAGNSPDLAGEKCTESLRIRFFTRGRIDAGKILTENYGGRPRSIADLCTSKILLSDPRGPRARAINSRILDGNGVTQGGFAFPNGVLRKAIDVHQSSLLRTAISQDTAGGREPCISTEVLRSPGR